MTAEGAESKGEDKKGAELRSPKPEPVEGVTLEEIKQENEGGEKKLDESVNKSVKSSRVDESMNKSQNSFLSKEDYKFEIPDTCFLKLMKGFKIEKLSQKYILAAHPYPTLEGEMILFQPLKSDQYDKDIIFYRDYSLRKRIPTRPKPKKLSSYQ